MRGPLQHTQNFIRNESIVKRLIRKSNISGKDIVIDIGAGEGIITKELAKVSKEVHAIESDPSLYQNLLQLTSRFPNIKVLNQDFFTHQLPQGPYKIFANPPFSRTADIIHKLLDSKNPPTDSYLFLQREAAERFIPQKDYKNTQISLLYHPWVQVEIISKISRTSFVPTPSVDVVFTHFSLRKKPLIDRDLKLLYQDFISYTFNQWQPSVLDSLKRVFTYNQQKRIKKDLKIISQTPSELSFSQWAKLFDVFVKYTDTTTKSLVKGYFKSLSRRQENIEKTHQTRKRRNVLRRKRA